MAITFSCDVSRTSIVALLLLAFTFSVQAAAPTPSCTLYCAGSKDSACTGGVAPLLVQSDCTATTDADTSNPFHDLYYETSWGDSVSGEAGLWQYGTTGNRNKNYSIGAVAGHVFESAGDKTVTTSVWDGTSRVTTSHTITVTDPNTVFSGTNTICVNASGSDFTGCPSGAATHTQSNFVTAISSYTCTGCRTLFKRGDTFTTSSTATITATGPGIVGAFGTGAKPQVTATTVVDGMLSFNAIGNYDYTWGDWRVQDLSFRCGNYGGGTGLKELGGFVSILLLRINVDDCFVSFNFGADVLHGRNNNGGATKDLHAHVEEQLGIVESTDNQNLSGSNTVGGWNVYAAGNRFMFMGNLFDNIGDRAFSHLVRLPISHKFVISHNHLLHPNANFHAIKMHSAFRCNAHRRAQSGNCTALGLADDALAWADDVGSNNSTAISGNGYTEYNIISDNYVVAGSAAAWMFAISPQDTAEDERVRNIIVERNHFHQTSSMQAGMRLAAQQVTVRNNLLEGAGNAVYFAILWADGGEPTPTDLWIYNNTMYTTTSASEVGMFDIRNNVASVTLRNNLAYAPNANVPHFWANFETYGAGASDETYDHNSSDTQMDGTSPLFAGATNLIDFRSTCTGSTYPCNNGITITPYRDMLNCVPKSGNPIMGAFTTKTDARCSGGK